MSRLFKRGPHAIQANLTPLIDVTFLLIVFFVLVTKIPDLDNADMDLPTPLDPASELIGEQFPVVINVLPEDGGLASGYKLGRRTFRTDPEALEDLTDFLAARYRKNPALQINLRADRSTHYEWVDRIFVAVNKAAERSGQRDSVNGRINLVVSKEP